MEYGPNSSQACWLHLHAWSLRESYLRQEQSDSNTVFHPNLCPLIKDYCLIRKGPLSMLKSSNLTGTRLHKRIPVIVKGVCHWAQWCGIMQERLQRLRDVDVTFAIFSTLSSVVGLSVSLQSCGKGRFWVCHIFPHHT
jgi:hypothetical protein